MEVKGPSVAGLEEGPAAVGLEVEEELEEELED